MEVRAKTDSIGKVRYYLRTVYFCHKSGFIVACHTCLGRPSKTIKERTAAGKTEVLGKVNNKCCTRYYSILAAREDQKGYLIVAVYGEWRALQLLQDVMLRP